MEAETNESKKQAERSAPSQANGPAPRRASSRTALAHFSRTTVDRVRANTDPEALARIDQRIETNVHLYAGQPKEIITRRIQELEREWDIEQFLETNASALALTGVVFGILGAKRWLWLSGGVLSFLLQHGIQGWCPPVPLLRRLGVRTKGEIEREKYALKAVRGDFTQVEPDKGRNGDTAREALEAVDR